MYYSLIFLHFLHYLILIDISNISVTLLLSSYFRYPLVQVMSSIVFIIGLVEVFVYRYIYTHMYILYVYSYGMLRKQRTVC